jgi:hypothetical protein
MISEAGLGRDDQRVVDPGRELEHLVDLADQRGLVDFTDLRQANSAALQAVLEKLPPGPDPQ